MPTKIGPGDILARNPHIDPERLEKTREMLRRLREMGWPRKGYELSPPFGGRRVAPDETPREDPRLVRLGRVCKIVRVDLRTRHESRFKVPSARSGIGIG